MSRTAALILAGGKMKPDMAAVAGGAANRALITVGGRPMLDHVVDALRAGLAEAGQEHVRLLVAGDGVPTPQGCVSLPGGASLVDTLLSGASALEPDETRLLVATADIPFLTPRAVCDLLKQADALTGPAPHFVYPVVEAGLCRARFPRMKRTTLRIAEGEFTGGNVVLLDPAFLRANDALLRRAYARRKSVAGIAALLGGGTLARLALSRAFPGLLAIPHLEAAVGRALGGMVARAVVSPHPEIAADVDRPDDVLLAREMLG